MAEDWRDKASIPNVSGTTVVLRLTNGRLRLDSVVFRCGRYELDATPIEYVSAWRPHNLLASVRVICPWCGQCTTSLPCPQRRRGVRAGD